ncbi:hypothetical protein DS832_04700 [Bombilactobacillus bombi]|uniref:Uncharacterized protein n=1 Tax=Bombilactobacillus bombi TaxID=1303590 RepID=A0A417Z833_9LACO|nr:hypothetical protein [Bombilactobacillus bombi]RHW46791.1 hypothetical protein DS832_04700 [Bombilactobacillus bombi]
MKDKILRKCLTNLFNSGLNTFINGKTKHDVCTFIDLMNIAHVVNMDDIWIQVCRDELNEQDANKFIKDMLKFLNTI